MFGLFEKNKDKKTSGEITDSVSSDPTAIEREAGISGRILIHSLDTAVSWQTDFIASYVRQLRASHPDETPEQIQKRIDSQFLTIVTGTGGAAGSAALVPGIGFITGLGAIAIESLVFLDIAAWHTLASARLRGIDITDEERRKSLILVTLLGSSGSALVAATIGEGSLRQHQAKNSAANMLTRLGVPQLGGINQRLIGMAQKRLFKKVRMSMLGKLAPLGIGAVLGATANRSLGRKHIERAHSSLGPVPTDFDADLSVSSEDVKKAENQDDPTPPILDEVKADAQEFVAQNLGDEEKK
ncbi:hypothetical protein KRX51_03970 [Corynebacterium sp. TAE3-ERU12]|uniref:hypothetical protein n=1 Tax=Corynebacterium sp. TAE3-ERU12 TaxID=2849491 RepID=UPI001C454691|nr:hypothetical protein [Corynebacterium sp. TAE3-ERU12]MBV7295075.1 hypothetical protein [Corynebacterium sp. TAE3-ERU12]